MTLLFLTLTANLLCRTSGRRLYDTLLPIISEIAYQPEPAIRDIHASQAYVGSPSYLQSGQDHYLASHDLFFNTPNGTAYIYFSSNMVDWEPVANVTPMYWAQLFMVGENVYITGTSGDTKASWMISKCLSTPCDGRDWSDPTVLFSNTEHTSYHCAPTPVVNVNNMIYRAMEKADGSKPGTLGVTVISADTSCDLLDPSCWKMSNSLFMEPSWVNMTSFSTTSWEEAGIVDNAQGGLHVMVRLDAPLDGCQTLAECNRAALLDYDKAANQLSFRQIVSFPSSCNKFAVKRGPDNRYYALTNPVIKAPVSAWAHGSCLQRNTVVLTVSDDLVHWKTCDTVLYDDTGLALNDSFVYTGLQYIDWSFDGADIVAAVRAAYRGAVTFHDANRLLLANITNYQQRCAS
eukprot:TRINITY_DN7050_c0_g1_i1.p1 TRINITY_DN7050_c0_g1~~TRINITY_DN7050_c0_g1_i1.p1  ORF type:complete len:404 (+),score=64.98 TRINITY_DN7050_c0_g1_i1:2-1213(+)